jgi:hypothetical protein
MAVAPKTALAKAAASEDRLKLLRELRARLVDAIDEVTCVRDLEPLARRLDVVSLEIDELRPPELSAVDVIAKRRAARRAKGAPVAYSHAEARGITRHG